CRAAEGNMAYMPQMESDIRAAGNTETADEIHSVGEGMRAAHARGDPFYVERRRDTPPARVTPSDLRTPVYVISPGRCGSACLDAVDVFTRFPNTTLIGAPTSADST